VILEDGALPSVAGNPATAGSASPLQMSGPPRRGQIAKAALTTANPVTEGLTMATDNPTPIPLTYEALNFIGARLGEHADNYTTAANDLLTVISNDLKLAAQICDRFASLRFDIGEVITKIEAPQTVEAVQSAHPVDITRELRAALEKAAAEV